ncbi:MarR family winged helix-turn-helix transcriptional regulator [Streptomyces albireticuli]|uniref:MarR family transcriptional regulator n=1 Tax=Streptomyces albireticuli TaxID=1940 RepID=A0A2A2DHM3_9ACTN|nr:MarR family transcriptional regulator [Streptomyces albireticuli]MCD9195195.1 MarR family transcriptional regulator [Streptomyces albireticuli]PAU50752.1 MarR family transcriptional regulator [Streptomyces albireticuli]
MTERDSVDEHVTRWRKILPDLDPVVEGAVARMSALVRHLGRAKEAALAEHGLQSFEYRTLHTLAGRDGRATPSELAAALTLSPSAMTSRLDGLERRGFVRREASATDRRKVTVELTAPGRTAWQSALETEGREEHRILRALDPAERELLGNLLRRVLIEAEREPRSEG